MTIAGGGHVPTLPHTLMAPMAIFCSLSLSRDHISIKFAIFVVGVVFVGREEVVKSFLSVLPFEGNDELFNRDTMFYPSDNQVPLGMAEG